MNAALTDWLSDDADFASRESCLVVLNQLLEKQCALLALILLKRALDRTRFRW